MPAPGVRMASDPLNELHELAADLDGDRRRLAHALADLAQQVIDHLTDPAMKRTVRTALGLAMRLLSVRDGLLQTQPWAALVPIGGSWRIVVGRSHPAVAIATDPLSDPDLYAIFEAVQRLERDDAVSVGAAVRMALPVDVVVIVEHQLASEAGLPVADLWATLGVSVRDTSRLVTLPKEL